jgi:hypothetical protein
LAPPSNRAAAATVVSNFMIFSLEPLFCPES